MHARGSFIAAVRGGVHFLFGGSSGIDLRIDPHRSEKSEVPGGASHGRCVFLQWRYATDGEEGWRSEHLCIDCHGRLCGYPSIPLLCGRPGNRSFEAIALPVFLALLPVAAARRALSAHEILSPYAAALCRRLRPLLNEREYYVVYQALIAHSFVEARYPRD